MEKVDGGGKRTAYKKEKDGRWEWWGDGPSARKEKVKPGEVATNAQEGKRGKRRVGGGAMAGT